MTDSSSSSGGSSSSPSLNFEEDALLITVLHTLKYPSGQLVGVLLGDNSKNGGKQVCLTSVRACMLVINVASVTFVLRLLWDIAIVLGSRCCADVACCRQRPHGRGRSEDDRQIRGDAEAGGKSTRSKSVVSFRCQSPIRSAAQSAPGIMLFFLLLHRLSGCIQRMTSSPCQHRVPLRSAC